MQPFQTIQDLKKHTILQREQALQCLDVRYTIYITSVLQQKCIIMNRIQKEYDKKIQRIDELLLLSSTHHVNKLLLPPLTSPATEKTLDEPLSAQNTDISSTSCNNTNMNVDNNNNLEIAHNINNIDHDDENKTDPIRSIDPISHKIKLRMVCAACLKTVNQALIQSLQCTKCYSVYHANCITNKQDINTSDDEYICDLCKDQVLNTRHSLRIKNKKKSKHIPMINTSMLRRQLAVKKYTSINRKKSFATTPISSKIPKYQYLVLKAIYAQSHMTHIKEGISRECIINYIESNYRAFYSLAVGAQFVAAIRRAISIAISDGLLQNTSSMCWRLTTLGMQALNIDTDTFKASISAYIQPFVGHMSMEEAAALSINDAVDHRDKEGRFLGAVVVGKKGDILRICYFGFGDIVSSNYKNELHRFARYQSISKRKNSRHFDVHINIGAFVDIYVKNRWRVAEVLDFDDDSMQIKCLYNDSGNYCFWWVHIDNNDELQPLNTKQTQNRPTITYFEMMCDESVDGIALKKLLSYDCHKKVVKTKTSNKKKFKITRGMIQKIEDKNNKLMVLKSKIWNLWEVKEADIKSQFVNRVDGTCKKGLIARLKDEMKQFITEQNLADEWLKRWNNQTWVQLKQQTFFQLCVDNLNH